MKRFIALLCAFVLLFTGVPSASFFVNAKGMDFDANSYTEETTFREDENIIVAEMEERELFPDLRPKTTTFSVRSTSLEHELPEAFMACLKENFGNCETQFSVEQFGMPYSRWSELQAVIWYETPEFFHVYSLGCSYDSSTDTVHSIHVNYLAFADTAKEYQTCLGKLKSGADYLLQDIKNNNALSDVEKALLLHDRLAVWNEYDVVGANTSNTYNKIHTAYGALGEGTSVCQGYAMAYMYLLEQAGIESDYCSSNALNHGWNIVYIDDTAYHVDVTWDDPVNGSSDTYNDDFGRVYHRNFLLSSSGILNSGHDANDYNNTPNDNRYEQDMWWMDSYTAVQLIDNRLYYLDHYNAKVICADNGSTVCSFAGCTSDNKLSQAEGMLLYSSDYDVIAINPQTGKTGIVYTSNNGYIEGMKYEKGKIWLQIYYGSGNSQRISVDYLAPEFIDFTYTVEGNKTTITGYTGTGGEVVIPATLGGYPVTKIGEWAFASNKNVTSVEISNNVTIIGEGAFYGCSYLSSVIIPDSVNKIGELAFAGCIRMETVTLPKGINAIFNEVFYYCENLTSVTIPVSVDYIGEGAFSNCTKLTDVYYDGTEEQWNAISVESDNEPLLNAAIHFPEPKNTDFTYYVENEEAIITGYTGTGGDITIPSTLDGYPVTTLMGGFEGNNLITKVTVPEGVTSILYGVFKNCGELTSVTLPDSVTNLGQWAFGGCKKLTNVTLGNGITSIPYSAFENCIRLDSITIPDCVEDIEQRAFYGCSALLEVNLGSGVTTIGKDAFRMCESLTELDIPDSVTTIKEWAFYYCTNLETVYIGSGLATLGECAFLQCYNLSRFVVNTDNANFSHDQDGILYNKDKTTLIQAPCTISGNYTISSDVKTIGEYAFAYCSDLTGIDVPDSVIELGAFAFEFSGVQSAKIGKGVTEICDYLFYRCEELTQIDLLGDVAYIGYNAFSDCTALESITLPETVQQIRGNAFQYCSALEEVHIPATTTSVDWNAFGSCTSLIDVYFGGSEELWNAINVDQSNTALSSANIRFARSTVAHGNCGSGLTWVLDNAYTLTIAGTGYMNDFAYLVEPWSTYRTVVRRAVVGYGVKSVGSNAFSGCINMQSVTLSLTVKSLGKWAFYDCDRLSSVEISANVTSMGQLPFFSCNSLTGIWVEKNNADFASDDSGVLFNKDKSAIIQAPGGIAGNYAIPSSVTSVEYGAFSHCEKLTGVTIPNSVTSLAYGAFWNCKSLKSLDIPDSVSSIGASAFSDCADLKIINLPDGLSEIANDLFIACYALEEITIPDSVFAINDYAFYSCRNLKKVTIGNQVSFIGNEAFNGCVSLEAISLPDSVVSIGEFAFDSCGLQSVTIGKGLMSIGEKAFSNCRKLTDFSVDPENDFFSNDSEGVLFNKNMTVLLQVPTGDHLDLSYLTEYVVPDGVEVISQYAFYYCMLLHKLTLPISITKIEDGAFTVCGNLSYVYYDGSEEQWNTINIEPNNDFLLNANIYFDGAENIDYTYTVENGEATITGYVGVGGDITIPDTLGGFPVTVIGDHAFVAYPSLQSVTIPYGVTVIGSGAFSDCTSLTSVLVPNSVTTIGESVFSGCSSLTSLIIPDSVTTIGDCMFSGCSRLTTVTIPSGITDIGNCFFTGCTSLTSVVIPNSVTTIGQAAFSDCTSLTSITIPDDVTIIGLWSFEGCTALTSVVMSESVTVISDGAFGGCNSLVDVYYGGTEAQWEAISMSPGNECLQNATIHFAKHSHSYVATVTPPTCTEQGYTTYICSCGDTYIDDYVGIISHSYTKTVTKPTCTAKGYTTYTCECGDTYKDNYTNAKGHTYSKGKCTACGYKPAGVKITAQPVNVAVANGKTAKVTVKASGTGVKYVWYMAKKGSSKFTKTTVTSSSYSVKMSSSVNGQKVYCEITDSYGNVIKSNTVTLYKGTPVKIKTQPKGITVANGKTGKLEVKASGSSLKYQWYVKYKGASSFTKVGKSSKSYSFTMASKFSGAQAYCVVKDKYGIEVKSSVVTIKMPVQPKVTTQPKSVTQVSGKKVSFSVKASGEGLKYQWYYAKKGSSSFKKVSGAKSATYSVKVSSSVNGRKYYCLVTDKYGQTVKSSTATLTMKTVAKITTQPKNITAKNGATAKVSIKAVGDGLKYNWYYGFPESEWIFLPDNNSSISFKVNKSLNGCMFKCVVTDKYGNRVTSKVVTLKVK